MIDLDEFLARSGIELRSLEYWIEREWLVGERQETRIALSDMDFARARFIHELKVDFGVNDEGVEIVLHLLDQLHGARRALAAIQAEADGDRKLVRRRFRRRKFERYSRRPR